MTSLVGHSASSFFSPQAVCVPVVTTSRPPARPTYPSIVYAGICDLLLVLCVYPFQPSILHFPTPITKMKGHWLLLPATASCLGVTERSVPRARSEPFINVCRNLALAPATGELSGTCNAEKTAAFDASADSYVNLNECLA